MINKGHAQTQQRNLKTTFEKKLATKSQNVLRSTSLKKEKIIKAKAKGSRNFPKTYQEIETYCQKTNPKILCQD